MLPTNCKISRHHFGVDFSNESPLIHEEFVYDPRRLGRIYEENGLAYCTLGLSRNFTQGEVQSLALSKNMREISKLEIWHYCCV